MTPSHTAIDRQGLAAATVAYVLWGVFPLYWYLLRQVPALEVIAHRIIWCAVFVAGWLSLSQGRGWLRAALVPGVGRMLLASSILISVNWGLYIWAVTHGHVVEASLGYFINPLVNVLLGVLLLRERLNPAQWAAVAVAAAGVLWLTLLLDRPPWIALSLAFSFSFYGLIRKVAQVDAVPGLAVESLLMLLPALLLLAWMHLHGQAAFLGGQPGLDLLMVLGGVLTALPLIGFAFGARRIPYSLIGFLQYIAPSLQLVCGVWLLGESFSGVQAIGFGCIWAALIIYAADMLRRMRKPRLARRESPADTVPGCDGGAPPPSPDADPASGNAPVR